VVPDVSLLERHDPWALRHTPHLYPNPQCRERRAYGEGFCSLARCWREPDDPRRIPCLRSETLMATTARAAALLTAYMIAGEGGHPVEVRPISDPAHAERARKTALLKPWLREDLPHVILLDPTTARAYGHPSGGAPELPSWDYRRFRVAAMFARAQVDLGPVAQCVQEMPPERLTHAVGSHLEAQAIEVDEPTLPFHAWDALVATCLGQAGPRG
jgi:hypothetical protein